METTFKRSLNLFAIMLLITSTILTSLGVAVPKAYAEAPPTEDDLVLDLNEFLLKGSTEFIPLYIQMSDGSKKKLTRDDTTHVTVVNNNTKATVSKTLYQPNGETSPVVSISIKGEEIGLSEFTVKYKELTKDFTIGVSGYTFGKQIDIEINTEKTIEVEYEHYDGTKENVNSQIKVQQYHPNPFEIEGNKITPLRRGNQSIDLFISNKKIGSITANVTDSRVLDYVEFLNEDTHYSDTKYVVKFVEKFTDGSEYIYESYKLLSGEGYTIINQNQNVIYMDSYGEVTINTTAGNKTLNVQNKYEECLPAVKCSYKVKDDGTVNISNIEFSNTEMNPVIPSTINEKEVTSIGGEGFEGIKVAPNSTVTIPEGVTFLGHRIFKHDTVINKLNLPSTLSTIDLYTFDNATIKIIELEEGTTKIPNSAFDGITVDEIILPKTVIEIGGSAFSESTIGKLIIPKSVTTIGSSAFSSVTIEELIIPSGVKVIPHFTFNEATINNLTLSDGIEEIQQSALAGLKTNELILPSSLKTLGGDVFNRTELDRLTIPKSLTKMEKRTFEDLVVKEIEFEGAIPQDGYTTLYDKLTLTGGVEIYHYGYGDHVSDNYTVRSLATHARPSTETPHIGHTTTFTYVDQQRDGTETPSAKTLKVLDGQGYEVLTDTSIKPTKKGIVVVGTEGNKVELNVTGPDQEIVDVRLGIHNPTKVNYHSSNNTSSVILSIAYKNSSGDNIKVDTPLEKIKVTSSNEDVLKVSTTKQGEDAFVSLERYGKGKTDLTIQVEDFTVTYPIEVVDYITNLDEMVIDLTETDTQEFSILRNDSAGVEVNVTNTVEENYIDNTILEVIGNRVKGLQIGRGYISFFDTTASISNYVNVIDLDTLSITTDATDFTEGNTIDFKVEATMTDSSVKDVTDEATYTLTDTDVATVTQDGKLLLNKAGTTTLTADYSGKTITIDLTVTPTVTITNIEVTPSAVTLEEQQTTPLTVRANYSDGTSKDVSTEVTMSSIDQSIATVTDSTVTAVSEGTTTISVTYEGATAMVPVTITAKPKTLVDIEWYAGETFNSKNMLDKQGRGDTVELIYSDSTRETLLDYSKLKYSTSNPELITFEERTTSDGTQPILSTMLEKPGKATITLEYEGVTKTYNTSAYGYSLTDSEGNIIPNTVRMEVGDTFDFKVIKTNSDLTTEDGTSEVKFVALAGTEDLTEINGNTLTALKQGPGYYEMYVTDEEGNYQNGYDSIAYIINGVKELRLSLTDITIQEGQTIPYTLTALYTYGAPEDITNTVIPTTTGTPIAEVKDGNIKALTVGTQTFTFEYKGKTIDMNVTVTPKAITPPPVTDVSIMSNKSTLTLTEGEEEQLTVTLTKSDSTTEDITNTVTYTVQDNTVAEVTNGKVKALTEGTTSIAIAYKGLTTTVTLTVEEDTPPVVTPPTLESIELDSFNAVMTEGETQALKVIGNYSDGTHKDVTSTTVFTTDATHISLTGNAVKAESEGNVNLTLQNGTVTHTVNITVKAKTVDIPWTPIEPSEPSTPIEPTTVGLIVTPNPITLSTGDTANVNVMAVMSDGTKEDVTNKATYTLTDGTVAELNGNTLTAIEVGTTELEVSYDSLTEQVSINIKANEEPVLPEPPATQEGLQVKAIPNETQVGNVITLTAHKEMSDGTLVENTGNTVFTSQDNAITINGDKVTAEKAGTYIIEANDGNLKTTITVTFTENNKDKQVGLKLNTDRTYLHVGNNYDLQAYAVMADGTEKNVTHETQFTVPFGSGLYLVGNTIYATQTGTYTVYAKHGEYVQTMQVVVYSRGNESYIPPTVDKPIKPLEPAKPTTCVYECTDTLTTEFGLGKQTSELGMFSINTDKLNQGKYIFTLTHTKNKYDLTVQKMNSQGVYEYITKFGEFPKYVELTINNKELTDKVMLRKVDGEFVTVPFITNEKSLTVKMLEQHSLTFHDKEQKNFNIKDKQYKNIVNEMYNRKIVHGVTTTDFAPNEQLTREHMTAIIARSLGLTEMSKTNFKDVNTYNWSYAYVTQLHNAGIVIGYGDGTFKPKEHITAKHLHTMLNRVSESLTGNGIQYNEYFKGINRAKKLTRAEGLNIIAEYMADNGFVNEIK